MTEKILIVCAHADDEVLGMGGTIAKLSKLGHEIAVQFLADGESSRENVLSLEDKIQSRQNGAQNAANLLGIKHLYYENFPDNKMDSLPFLDIVKVVEKSISEYQPNVIYTHYRNDLNIDHRITFQAVMTASRPIKGNHFPKKIYSFEVCSSSEWTNSERFNPNVYYDISEFLHTKIEALKCYDLEMRDFPHPRSYKAIESLSNIRGSECGFESAEAFMCIRSIF